VPVNAHLNASANVFKMDGQSLFYEILSDLVMCHCVVTERSLSLMCNEVYLLSTCTYRPF